MSYPTKTTTKHHNNSKKIWKTKKEKKKNCLVKCQRIWSKWKNVFNSNSNGYENNWYVFSLSCCVVWLLFLWDITLKTSLFLLNDWHFIIKNFLKNAKKGNLAVLMMFISFNPQMLIEVTNFWFCWIYWWWMMIWRIGMMVDWQLWWIHLLFSNVIMMYQYNYQSLKVAAVAAWGKEKNGGWGDG